MNRRTTIASAALALGVGLAVAVPVAVQAHTPDLTCTGDTLHLSLQNYPAGSTVSATLDDVTLLDGFTFGPEAYTASQAIDTTIEHTYSVTVRGSDGQGDQDYSGKASDLCGYIVTPPVTETPTPTPEPTPPVETPTPTPTPTDEPTPPVTPEPTTEPTPEDTPSPTTPVTPEPTPTSTAPVIVPTPTGGTTPPASAGTTTPSGIDTPSPSAPVSSQTHVTPRSMPVSADTSRTELAYTGADVAVPAIIAGLLLVTGALVLVYLRRMKRAGR